MHIIVKSRHTVLPDRLKRVAIQKFERLGKLLDRIQTIDVAIGEEKNPRVGDRRNSIEVTLTTTLRTIHAEAHGPDFQTAIDSAVAKLESQIRRLKGKAIDRSQRTPGHAAADLAAAANASNGLADAPDRIVRAVRGEVSATAASS